MPHTGYWQSSDVQPSGHSRWHLSPCNYYNIHVLRIPKDCSQITLTSSINVMLRVHDGDQLHFVTTLLKTVIKNIGHDD